MDERLQKVEQMVNDGIDEIVAKGSLDKDTVCLIGDLIDVRKDLTTMEKDLATIEAMEEAGYSEGFPGYYMDEMSYARRGGSSRGGSYARGGRGVSYARGGSRGGSYGRGGSYARGGSNRGYSRDDGREEMIESLMEAMENATTEHERESIRRMIMQAENG